MTQTKKTSVSSTRDERLIGLENRMGTFEHTLDTFGSELRGLSSKINDVLTLASSKQSFEPMNVLKFIALLTALLGGITGAITFLSSTVNDSRLAVIEFQTQQLWARNAGACERANIQRNP